MLHVTVEDLNEVVVLHCAGRIVRGDETSLLCVASRQHGRTVVLDLGRVDTIDAAGLGLLVSLQAAGIYLRLMNPSQSVSEMLRLTHLDSVFEVCEPQSGQARPEGNPVNDELQPEPRTFRLTA